MFYNIWHSKAVVDRYGAVEGSSTGGVDEKELDRLCKEIGAPFVTVVGFDKVRHTVPAQLECKGSQIFLSSYKIKTHKN
jgi:hypothetical protein